MGDAPRAGRPGRLPGWLPWAWLVGVVLLGRVLAWLVVEPGAGSVVPVLLIGLSEVVAIGGVLFWLRRRGRAEGGARAFLAAQEAKGQGTSGSKERLAGRPKDEEEIRSREV